MHNTSTDYNTGNIISCRRTKKSLSGNVKYSKPCPKCKGFYSRETLRKHYNNCTKQDKTGVKNVMIESRRIHGDIHSKASLTLKNEIFPVLREDEITNAIRHDELVIIYGNVMCRKYKSTHHHSMIRTRLRLIGRFLIAIKKINSGVNDFSCVFIPKNYDDVVAAINMVSNLDETTNTYAAPSTAFSLGTAIKYNARLFITECIKTGNKEKRKLASEFLMLMEQDLISSINKTVQENILEQKRHKKYILPTVNDIQKLSCYLEKSRRKYYCKLINTEFNYKNWINLAGYTLISIQVFNRRRAGELERALIADFNCRQSIDESTDPDFFNSLSPAAQLAAKKYERFVIRGKLARGVPVLLYKELVDNVNIILEYRQLAGVCKNNPYIFGICNKKKKNDYLRATKLLREYASECGAKNSSLLRGTQLRKHIASQSVLYNLKESETNDLATFLGHSTKIHKDHYQIPIVTRDIAQMSRLLEMAQGLPEDKSDHNAEVNNVFPYFEIDSISNKPETYIKKDRSNEFHSIIQPSEEKSSDNSTRHENIETRLKIVQSTKNSVNLDHATRNLVDSQHISRSNVVPVKPQAFIKRNTWTTPEKSTARNIFMKYITRKKLPSFIECVEAISKHDVLKNRTAIQLKLWVQNQITRNKRETSTSSSKYLLAICS